MIRPFAAAVLLAGLLSAMTGPAQAIAPQAGSLAPDLKPQRGPPPPKPTAGARDRGVAVRDLGACVQAADARGCLVAALERLSPNLRRTQAMRTTAVGLLLAKPADPSGLGPIIDDFALIADLSDAVRGGGDPRARLDEIYAMSAVRGDALARRICGASQVVDDPEASAAWNSALAAARPPPALTAVAVARLEAALPAAPPAVSGLAAAAGRIAGRPAADDDQIAAVAACRLTIHDDAGFERAVARAGPEAADGLRIRAWLGAERLDRAVKALSSQSPAIGTAAGDQWRVLALRVLAAAASRGDAITADAAAALVMQRVGAMDRPEGAPGSWGELGPALIWTTNHLAPADARRRAADLAVRFRAEPWRWSPQDLVALHRILIDQGQATEARAMLTAILAEAARPAMTGPAAVEWARAALNASAGANNDAAAAPPSLSPSEARRAYGRVGVRIAAGEMLAVEGLWDEARAMAAMDAAAIFNADVAAGLGAPRLDVRLGQSLGRLERVKLLDVCVRAAESGPVIPGFGSESLELGVRCLRDPARSNLDPIAPGPPAALILARRAAHMGRDALAADLLQEALKDWRRDVRMGQPLDVYSLGLLLEALAPGPAEARPTRP